MMRGRGGRGEMMRGGMQGRREEGCRGRGRQEEGRRTRTNTITTTKQIS